MVFFYWSQPEMLKKIMKARRVAITSVRQGLFGADLEGDAAAATKGDATNA